MARYFAGFTHEWHQRVALVSCGRGKWGVVPPDLDPENEDLTSFLVVALGRPVLLPQWFVWSFYCFDALAEADLRRLRSEAPSPARGVGFDVPGGVPQGSAATWLLCGDPGHSQFGLELAAGVWSGPEQFIEGVATALVSVIATAGADRTFFEGVAAADEDALKEVKQGGPGRASRISPVVMTARGVRRTILASALALLKLVDREDWPFRVPAVVEFRCSTGLESLASSVLDESSGVATSKFDDLVATEQKVAANILMRRRLGSDEIEPDRKKNYAGDAAPGGAKGGKGKRKEEG